MKSLHCPTCDNYEGLQHVTCTGHPYPQIFICAKCDSSFIATDAMVKTETLNNGASFSEQNQFSKGFDLAAFQKLRKDSKY